MSNEVVNTEITIKKADVLAQYQPVGSELRIELVVTGNPQKSKYVNPRLQEGSRGDTYSHSFFVNFKAVEARKAKSMLEKFEEYGGEEMPISEFKFGLTKEIIVHTTDKEAPQLPLNGDKVICQLQYAMKDNEFVLDQNGKKILEVRNMLIPEARKSSDIKWESFTGEEEKQSIAAPTGQGENPEDQF